MITCKEAKEHYKNRHSDIGRISEELEEAVDSGEVCLHYSVLRDRADKVISLLTSDPYNFTVVREEERTKAEKNSYWVDLIISGWAD